MTTDNFEQILEASQASGDYNPTWKRFVKTRFFVPLAPGIAGGQGAGEQFDVSTNPQNGKSAVTISEHAAHLNSGNFHHTATMSGAEIVRKLAPGIGIVIAMNDRTFGMPAALVERLKKSIEAAQAKSKATPAAVPSAPVVAAAGPNPGAVARPPMPADKGGFPTLDASLLATPAPKARTEAPALTLAPVDEKKSAPAAAVGLALEPVGAPAQAARNVPAAENIPGKIPAAPAKALNIGALTPRHVFNENLGLLLYIPGAWKEAKNTRSIQIVDGDTGATLEATGMERTGRTVEQWSTMRVPMVAQEFPYLRQVGKSTLVSGTDWDNRIHAITTEFRGIVPGDSEESTYLLCCVRTDSILIAVTICAKSRVAEQNRAVYDWIFSHLSVNDKTPKEKLEFDNDIVDERTDRTAMVASGQRLMILSIVGNFILLRFLQDAHHLIVLYGAFCVLAMSAFGLYRIAQGLLVPLWGKILLFIGLAVPVLSIVLLIGLRWMGRKYLRDAGYSTGFFGASEAIPKSNHDLRNIMIGAMVLALPLYGLSRIGGGSHGVALEAKTPSFSPPDHSFEVDMPGTPTEVRLASVPGATDSRLYQSMDGDWTYVAGYTEYAKEPEGVARTLDSMGQYYADRAQGRIVAEKNIVFQGGDGKDVKIQQADGAFAEVQYGFVGSRLFMVEVVYPAAQKTSPRIDAYLDSFSLQ
jgi:hypothetical protein